MPSVLNTAVQSGSGYNQLINATRDVYSAEIWFNALPYLKFDQFTTKKTELGVQPGDSIVMLKINDIPLGGKLTEGVRMATKPMSLATQRIGVDEVGNAISFSERLLNTSFYDQMSAASYALGRDMAKVLDRQLREIFRLAPNVVYAGTKTARNQLTAADVFDTKLVKDAVELLETNNAPKWNGDYYVCFCTPHQLRGLRDDADWINANNYANTMAIMSGEVGRYEDVRFVSTSAMPNGTYAAKNPITGDYVNLGFDPALAGAGASGTNIHQAIFFGEYSVGHATALPVELRDSGVVDFGREHGLAWYGIWGGGVLESGNMVIGETA